MFLTLVVLVGVLGLILFGKASVVLSAALISGIAIFQLFIIAFVGLQSLKRIAKADQKVASGIMQLTFSDIHSRFYAAFIICISLFQLFLVAFDCTYAALHLFLFACSIDLVLMLTKRLFIFSSVDGLLERFEVQVERELKNRNPEGALSWCESISQVAISGIRDHNSLQATSALNTLFSGTEQLIAWAPLSALFSSKSRFGADLSLVDRLQILVIYISQRALWIMQDALNSGLLPVAEQVVSFFGRVSCYLSVKHPEIAHVPLVQLLSDVQLLPEEKLAEIEVHLAVTMSEVVKSMLREAGNQKRLLLEPMIHVFRLLETHMGNSFRRKQKQNVALLMQPFAEIGQMVADPAVLSLDGIGKVKEQLQRLFTQFSTLETLQTTPFEAPQAQDSTSSFDSSNG